MGVHSRPNMWHLWHSVIGRGRPGIILKQAYKQRFLGILPSYQSRYFPLLHAVDYWWYGATTCGYCQQEMSSLHNSSIFRYINITPVRVRGPNYASCMRSQVEGFNSRPHLALALIAVREALRMSGNSAGETCGR